MAEVVEGVKHAQEIPSMGKANAALTTGIIGTSLSGLLTLGALGIGTGVFYSKFRNSRLNRKRAGNRRHP